MLDRVDERRDETADGGRDRQAVARVAVVEVDRRQHPPRGRSAGCGAVCGERGRAGGEACAHSWQCLFLNPFTLFRPRWARAVRLAQRWTRSSGSSGRSRSTEARRLVSRRPRAVARGGCSRCCSCIATKVVQLDRVGGRALGGGAPASARNAVHVVSSRLRGRSASPLVRSDTGGYLRGPGALDARRFQDGTEAAARELARGEPECRRPDAAEGARAVARAGAGRRGGGALRRSRDRTARGLRLAA